MHVSLSQNLISAPASLHACPWSRERIWPFLGQQISDLRSRPVSSAPYGQRGEMIIYQRDEGTHPNIMEIWSEARTASTSSPPPSHKQEEDSESRQQHRAFWRGTDVLSAHGIKLAPRANILQLDFGAVFIVWKRLFALGSELRTELKATLHFPLPRMMTAMHQWAAAAAFSAPCKMCRVIFFCTRKKMVVVTTKTLPLLCLRFTHFCHIQAPGLFAAWLGGGRQTERLMFKYSGR